MIAAWRRRHAARVAAWNAGGRGYVGRFAPSPTGPLHAGSLAAALASWLDARAHGGRWWLRIEDVDAPRTVAGAADSIIATLSRLGLDWDGEIMVQSRRQAAYRAAFDRLVAAGAVYPCACTRREIADSAGNLRETAFGRELVYPGTCRGGLAAGNVARAWRLRVPDAVIEFDDALAGVQRQHLAREVGDFVLLRADGVWAYQLAVVVDDAAQGVTHVVRGADLIASTARQMVLIAALGLSQARYLHVAVVTDAKGDKLSKQTGARPVDERPAELVLGAAWAHLEGRILAPARGATLDSLSTD